MGFLDRWERATADRADSPRTPLLSGFLLHLASPEAVFRLLSWLFLAAALLALFYGKDPQP